MKTRARLYFYSIAGFVTGIFALIGIQYTTNVNVENLINGNEELVKQYKMSSSLAELESDLLFIENRIKLAVITGDSTLITRFGPRIAEIRKDENLLEKYSDTVNLADVRRLNRLVNQRIVFNNRLINSFYHADRATTQRLMADVSAGKLGDSISALVEKIDTSGKVVLAQKIRSVDSNGQKVQRWNQFLAGLVILLMAGIFVLIINRMKKQTSLIDKLNESEKRLKAAALVKENFLANMSHEIRTPLNAILGYTQLLQKKQLDADTGFQIKTIRQSGETLLSVVNDILDLSKIESGMIRIEDAPFSLSELVHSITAMFDQKVEEKGLLLTTTLAANIPDILDGDAARLTQILVNLIGNAVKFTDTGEIVLGITGQQLDTNHIKVSFQVTDTGIGIDEEKLETIFERFRQAEDSTTRKFGGTGLGLSIARDLVHLQHGSIAIKSKYDAGTTVTVSIPYRISENQNDPARPDTAGEVSDFKSRLRVLIVEDNVINQGLMSRLMNELEVESKLAGNGKEAVEILQHENFDLVFMDIQMPEMDGYQATREIRNTLKLNVPIIAMTAHAMAGQREKCISSGMNEHLAKPVMESDLQNVFETFTGRKVSLKTQVLEAEPDDYKVIDLKYVREISHGDQDYERMAAGQFLDLVPDELASLQKAFDEQNTVLLKRIAHNLKSTVSVMGLDPVLRKDLDTLVYEDADRERQQEMINRVTTVCREALEETQAFFDHIQD
ncbi:hybrid sensor histidine kinase/response regulator [Dyadobacter pollutisoli]|uniref:histidine kinase n=1 Tax=Dyadobacter pollutisoli TaxID=2910158 RepID=A0A9E8NDE2_9BACT|nr:hybrid sensor histidine kinase/response regulator [Dyadobacter pollutisoli]WAC14674.1 ATP-binding protein [Dyadobacter pollutisoli]